MNLFSFWGAASKQRSTDPKDKKQTSPRQPKLLQVSSSSKFLSAHVSLSYQLTQDDWLDKGGTTLNKTSFLPFQPEPDRNTKLSKLKIYLRWHPFFTHFKRNNYQGTVEARQEVLLPCESLFSILSLSFLAPWADSKDFGRPGCKLTRWPDTLLSHDRKHTYVVHSMVNKKILTIYHSNHICIYLYI